MPMLTAFLRCILCSALLGIPTLTDILAGGWPQEKGKSYIQLTYGTASSNTVYKFDGETKYPTDNGGFTVRDFPLADRGLFLYLEYGITEDLTIIADAAFKRSIVTTPIERRETQGIGDIGLAGRYRVWNSGPHVLSARAGFTVPAGYSRDLTPPLGNGIPTLSLAGEYGISFYPAPAWATATLGYRLRPSIYSFSNLNDDTEEFEPDYADAVFADLEGGYTFADRILLKASLRFMTTVRADDNDFDVRHPPETEQYLKVGGGIGVSLIKGFGVSADIFATPLGKKTANSLDLFIGLSWQGKVFGGRQSLYPPDSPLESSE